MGPGHFFLSVLGLALFGVVILALAGTASWLDRRFSRTSEEVEADIEQYGEAAGGIRSELLPEAERNEVLAQRKADRASQSRWARWIPH